MAKKIRKVLMYSNDINDWLDLKIERIVENYDNEDKTGNDGIVIVSKDGVNYKKPFKIINNIFELAEDGKVYFIAN